MGKKGNKRKTRWRVLPIGGDNGDSLCSTNDEEGDGDRASSSPTTPVNGSWSNGRPAFSPRGPARPGKHRLGYQQSSYRQNSQRGGYSDSKPPLVTTEKKTFNEEEYTKITTPRQDVLFKKGYLGRKKPVPTNPPNSADANVTPLTEPPPLEIAGVADHELIEPHETPHFVYTNGYVDQGGVYYINGGSYELYDPYTGNVTVVVGPAPHGPPVLAAVSCQPVPLQPLEWFNPAFHSYVPTACPGRRKRSSTDSQNWSPQSSESTDPPGSPQEGEVVGLQNGTADHLEDCTVYQHTHQPPAYVYPGYMFGPAVYNMNGINIQGLPPQPQSIDISGSKRRKKKRRRRRRRGGADDGSDGSTTDENDLEEPVSLTSQESSQELESDSKTSAESAKAENGEANLPDIASQPAEDSVASSEKCPPILSEETDSSNINLQPAINECSAPLTSQESGDNHDPTTNSYVSELNSGIVNQQHDFQEINDTPSSNSINGIVIVQNSCNENVLNGPTKTEKLPLESNNSANSDGSFNKCNQNQNSTDGLGVTNSVTIKEKNKGKKSAKHNKQKQSQTNRTDCGEAQLTPARLQALTQKMDGNESAKSLKSNNDKDHAEASNETQHKTKPVCINSEQAESSDVTQVASNGDGSASSQRQISHNEVPKKTFRKDQQQHKHQQQKQTQKKLPVSAHKDRKERGGAPKHSTNQHNQHCSRDTAEKQTTAQKISSARTSCHSDEYENLSPPVNEICTKGSRTLENTKLPPVLKPNSSHSEHNTPSSQNTAKAKDYFSDEGSKPYSEVIATELSSSLECSAIKEISRNDDNTNVIHRTSRSFDVPENKIQEYKDNIISLEERHSPPPIPPPRRKKWNPCNKRTSFERPPTPGRDLEDRRSSEVLTDDSSSTSTSTSRESEESVIEIVSSTCNVSNADLGMLRQHSSETDERVICDTQHFFSTVSSAVLHSTDSAEHDSLHDDNDSVHQPKSSIEDTLSREKDNLSTFHQPNDVSGYIPHPLLGNHTQQTEVSSSEQCKNFLDMLPELSNDALLTVETFAEDMANRIIQEALVTICTGKSEQTLAWPITEAVTKWLHSQSMEEVLTIPDSCDSENDLIEDVEELNVNSVQENLTGPKNVLRNPLPVLSHKCNCTNDDTGTRVATINDKLNFPHNKDCVYFESVSEIGSKLNDINNNKCIVSTLRKTGDKDIQKSHDEYHITSSSDLYSNFLLEDGTQNVHNNRRDVETTFNVLQDDHDDHTAGESMEYDADWECDPIQLKPSPLISSLYCIEGNDISESPDDHCLHMCDPALSVAKYYRLGPPTEKVDSQDQMSNLFTESEEEIDSLEHFRNELYDSAYDSSQRSLADELEFCERPLPESWSIEHIKISKQDNDRDLFNMKYDEYKISDSGIQSEESGNEESRTPSTNSSNMFKNSSKLFKHNATIHMTGITGEGPFPCGGICCILQ